MSESKSERECTCNRGQITRLVSSSVTLSLTSIFLLILLFGELSKYRKCVDTTFIMHQTDIYFKPDVCNERIVNAKPTMLHYGDGALVVDNGTHCHYALVGNFKCEKCLQFMHVSKLKKRVMLCSSMLVVVLSFLLLIPKSMPLDNLHPAIYVVPTILTIAGLLSLLFDYRIRTTKA